jgi:hypothetical protein
MKDLEEVIRVAEIADIMRCKTRPRVVSHDLITYCCRRRTKQHKRFQGDPISSNSDQSHGRFRGRPRRLFGCVSPAALVSPCPFLFPRRSWSRALNSSTNSLAPPNSDSGIQVGSQSTQYCTTPLTFLVPMIPWISHKSLG